MMDRLRKTRNQTIPGTVIRAGLMNKTVTVSVTRMEFPHKKYRRHHAKVKAFGTLLVHDEGLVVLVLVLVLLVVVVVVVVVFFGGDKGKGLFMVF